VETEINLCLKLLKSRRVVGVTGSNGKTTTTHLVYQLLRAAGEKTWLGGNVGGSLLSKIDRIEEEDVVVLELSSFQLERTGLEGLGPDVAVITNLTPNHLDRHKDFAAYVEAKAQILARARGLVLNLEDEVSVQRFGSADVPIQWFSSKRELEEGYFLQNGRIMERQGNQERTLLLRSGIQLPGLFNVENMMAAIAAARVIMDPVSIPDAALEAAASFQGVPHRLETVATLKDVRYINDSIATTPVSCIAALHALEGDIYLIAGGYDKGLSLNEMAEVITRKVKAVFLVGDTASKLEHKIQNAAKVIKREIPPLENTFYLEDAVKAAASQAGPGSTVLLSPGFASYDQFLNFEERGEYFRQCVAAMES
jgi:UDP-N-acetylmuramoylalanine--D-glutamate ligase